jgi:predicted nucleotidyltransferase
MRYQADQEDDRFIRYRPDTLAAWPIDLMLVDEDTFTKLYSEGHLVDLGAVTVKAASPRHLITLKIHALKIYQEHRYTKDYNDVVHLLRSACPELRGDDLRALCIRYADSSLYDKLLRDLP